MTRDSLLQMMFKLGQCAEQSWQKLRGFAFLAKLVEGVKFINGEEIEQPDQVAARVFRSSSLHLGAAGPAIEFRQAENDLDLTE